jgi:dTDP-4-dehydrorhamnose 3,5-epimerase-like enzyme
MNNVRVLNLKNISDEKGNLTPIEATRDIPFEIKRVYYLYNVPQNQTRGYHAHKELQQLLVCINGSVEILCEDENGEKQTYLLDRADKGLFVGSMVWHEMMNFSKDCVLVVFASEYYNEIDYIRNYDDFLQLSNIKRQGSMYA